MRRILVVGCCGAGKTTLSRELGEILRIPVYHLDRYFWKPGWVEDSKENFDAALAKLLQRMRGSWTAITGALFPNA